MVVILDVGCSCITYRASFVFGGSLARSFVGVFFSINNADNSFDLINIKLNFRFLLDISPVLMFIPISLDTLEIFASVRDENVNLALNIQQSTMKALYRHEEMQLIHPTSQANQT